MDLRKRGNIIPSSETSHHNVNNIVDNNIDKTSSTSPSSILNKLKPRGNASKCDLISLFLSKLRIHTAFLFPLFLIWLSLIYYFQRINPSVSVAKCSWPIVSPEHKNEQHNVLVIADPQLVDDHTYPSRPRWIQYITTRISDNYMSVNYKQMQQHLQPDSVIFVGDLFDGGREWFDEKKWFLEYQRFNKIFPPIYPNQKTYYNILGNHDAGWDRTMNKSLIHRFQSYFGKSNTVELLGNHTFLFLDTISLSANNNNDTTIQEDAMKEFKQLKEITLPKVEAKYLTSSKPEIPRIILTHVPFFRDPSKQACRGPREKSHKPFPLMNGGTYQTVLFPNLTNDLLHEFTPKLILGGDDHDYCEIDHYYDTYKKGTRNTKEITVKSYSMNMGIKYPAAQLLSLYNPLDESSSDQNTYATNLCYGYSPFVTLNIYGLLLLTSLTYLFLICVYPERYIFLRRFIITRIFSRFMSKDKKNGVKYEPMNTDHKGTDIYSASMNRVELESEVSEFGLVHGDWLAFFTNLTALLLVLYVTFAYFYVIL